SIAEATEVIQPSAIKPTGSVAVDQPRLRESQLARRVLDQLDFVDSVCDKLLVAHKTTAEVNQCVASCTAKVEVDLVCHGGSLWLKCVARNPRGLSQGQLRTDQPRRRPGSPAKQARLLMRAAALAGPRLAPSDCGFTAPAGEVTGQLAEGDEDEFDDEHDDVHDEELETGINGAGSIEVPDQCPPDLCNRLRLSRSVQARHLAIFGTGAALGAITVTSNANGVLVRQSWVVLEASLSRFARQPPNSNGRALPAGGHCCCNIGAMSCTLLTLRSAGLSTPLPSCIPAMSDPGGNSSVFVGGSVQSAGAGPPGRAGCPAGWGLIRRRLSARRLRGCGGFARLLAAQPTAVLETPPIASSSSFRHDVRWPTVRIALGGVCILLKVFAAEECCVACCGLGLIIILKYVAPA
uniref:Zf-Tim10_DDP domain-containing protein n=1 Tax=Macrostomum lignano TaxID=282301 RepID=A0A1I8JP12_9PLAT